MRHESFKSLSQVAFYLPSYPSTSFQPQFWDRFNVCWQWSRTPSSDMWGAIKGSYLRIIHSCITQLKAQRPSKTCNESKEEEEENQWRDQGSAKLSERGPRNQKPAARNREPGIWITSTGIGAHPQPQTHILKRRNRCAGVGVCFEPRLYGTQYPQPSALHPEPWTLHPEP